VDLAFPFDEDIMLRIDLPDVGLVAGDVGTVVECHAVPGMEMGYSVEFFDILGNTVAVVTLPASALRRPMMADRPFVRQVNSIVEP